MLARIWADRSIWWHYTWVLPAALGAAVVSFLCWDAWNYGRDVHWLAQDSGLWVSALQPGQNWTLVVALGLGVSALFTYWLPRRRDRIPIGLITVAAMVLTAAVLGTLSYLPCQGELSTFTVLFWVLQLYVGQPPSAIYQSLTPAAACHGQPPLALQLGQFTGLGATLFAGAAVAAVLWRQPLDRLRSRFARKVTVFTGLDALTIPLLLRLAAPETRRNVIVIEPDEKHPLLDEARATGARVIIGQPATRSLLQPILSSWRGCTLDRIYALSSDTAENDAVLDTARDILVRYPLSTENHPHLVARVDDPRHASHWRGSHGSNPAGFEDALSPAETTAHGLVDEILQTSVRRLIVCGDSSLTLAVLIELDRRSWEQRELIAATTAGLRAKTRAADDHQSPPLLHPLSISHVLLIDLQAADIRREFLATTPRAVPESMLTARLARWEDDLLPVLDMASEDDAATTGVIIANSLTAENMHRAGRIARLHPNTWIYIQSKSGHATREAIFDRLRLYQSSLLVTGNIPEDTWMRVARHWHECFRLEDPVPPGHPKASARLAWTELSDFLRQDNLLQVRSILAAVARLGRQWVPVRMVPQGSYIELGEQELEAVAMIEHDRWHQRRLSARRHGNDAGVSSSRLVLWKDLSKDERARSRKSVQSQVAQLEEVGFVPIIPFGGPTGAASYERVGTVEARRLHTRYAWLRRPGEVLHGEAGDWRVVDDHGRERTVGDSEFRAAHDFLADQRWRRTGAFRAWQVDQELTMRTREGIAVAAPGDWVVEGVNGERWPVPDEQFRQTYRRAVDEDADSPSDEPAADNAPGRAG